MTAASFNPRQRLTVQQARRLARAIQSPDDVSAQIADMRAREEAARVPVGAVPLVRSPRRRASSWFAPIAFAGILAVVAMGYVVLMVPR